MTINQNFKKLRKTVGFTQEELAAKLRIGRPALGSYEEGRAEVPTKIIKVLIDKGFVLKEELYDFMFNEKWDPFTTIRFRKMLSNFLQTA